MMRDAFIDVRLELDLAALEREDDMSAFVIERSRHEADRLCDEARARLRTDRAPEVVVQHGEHRLTGQKCLLVATRWAVVVPDGVEVRR